MLSKLKKKSLELYVVNLKSRALNDLVEKLFLVRELRQGVSPKEQDIFYKEFERTRTKYWGETYFSSLFPALCTAEVSRARHHTMIHLKRKCDWFEIAAYNLRKDYSRFTEANGSKEQKLYYDIVREVLYNIKNDIQAPPERISTVAKRFVIIEKLSRLDMKGLKTVEDVILADTARLLIINLLTSYYNK